MKTYVIRRPSAWADLPELEIAGAKSARIGNDEMSDRVRWIAVMWCMSRTAALARFASTRHATVNRSESTRGALACRARNFMRSPPQSS